MKIFLTGATGYVGQAVIRALRTRGHEVSGLVRSSEGAKQLLEQSVAPVMGDLTNLDLLREHSRASEGVVHTAFQFSPPQINASA